MSTYYIKALEQTKTPEQWGMDGLTLHLASGSADTLKFSLPCGSMDADASICEGEIVELWRDEVRIFRGCLMEPAFSFSQGVWRESYTASGPWYDLERIMAQQLWTKVDSDTETEESINQCRILFGVDSDGGDISTGAMIVQLLDNAIERGVQIQRGTIFSGIEAPSWEETDVTIAEALQSILKWHPSAVCFWDYSPAQPTLHIQLASELATIEQDITADNVESVDLTPRSDLVISAAAILYELVRKYQEVTVLRPDGHYKQTTLATAQAHNWTITAEGEEREYEVLITEKSPSDADISAPGTLIHTVTWSDPDVPIPTSVSAAIVSESGQLYLDGAMMLHAGEVSFAQWLGSLISFAHAPSRWADAVAIVTSVDYDFSKRTTKISVSPGGSLGVQDWIDLLTRRRNTTSASSYTVVSGRVSAAAGAWNAIPDETLDAVENPPSGMPEGFAEQTLIIATGTGVATKVFLTKAP